jgi:hypothetical protein
MAAAVSVAVGPAGAGVALARDRDAETTTPVQHVVVIFQENAIGPFRLDRSQASTSDQANFVDGTLTDQSSILRFIEDNWNTGRIGDGSSDAIAGTLDNICSTFITGRYAGCCWIPSPASRCKNVRLRFPAPPPPRDGRSGQETGRPSAPFR